MPFAVAEHDGVLTLTLDTPRSTVNIFNQTTARHLLDILARVTPQTTRAIVFETAKPGSFINGVGLLLAHAAQTPEGIAAAAGPPWAAYRAVRETPVPTIAVVQGSCFGCGVEFALQCRFRLASDSGETRFYMTELNDYRFLPLFGSTWNLPEAVGLEHAVDLLLWGARWDAHTAYTRGLVDAVAPHGALAAHRTRFIAGVLDGTQPSRRRGPVRWSAPEDRVVEAARARIAALPPALAEVYTAGLALLVQGARQTGTHVTHQSSELRASAASALSAVGKSAFAFFYLRQMASERATGRLPRDTEVTLGASGAVGAFTRRLQAQPIPGVRWTDTDAADFRFVEYPSTTRRPHDVTVHLTVASVPSGGASLYAPTGMQGRLIELAWREDGGPTPNPPALAALARILQRYGFEVARTTPTSEFVSDALLAAYLAPLVRRVTDAEAAVRVNATLRAFGIVQRPHVLLAAFDRRPLLPSLAHVTDLDPTVVDERLTTLADTSAWDAPPLPSLLDGLCLSLLATVASIRAQGTLRDAATIDLIARELLDFPLHRTSLCSWLTRARVAKALAVGPPAITLASSSAAHAAEAFVRNGRDFYR